MAKGGGLCPAKTVIFLGSKTHRAGEHFCSAWAHRGGCRMPSYRRIIRVEGGVEYWVRMKVPRDLIGIYTNEEGKHVAEVVKFCGINQQEFDANSPAIIEGFRREFEKCRRQRDNDPALEAARRAEAALDRLLKRGDVAALQEVCAAIVQNAEQFIAEARKQQGERRVPKILGLFAENNQSFNDGDAGIRRLGEHKVVGDFAVDSQEIYWAARARIDAARAPAVVITLDMAIADWKAAHGPWGSPEAEKKATEAKERAAKSLFVVAGTNNMAAIDTMAIQKWKDGLTGRTAYDYMMDVRKLYQCLEQARRFGKWMKNPTAAIERPRRSRGA